MRFEGGDGRTGVSTAAVAGIVVVILVAGVLAYYYYGTSTVTSISSTTPASSSVSSSIPYGYATSSATSTSSSSSTTPATSSASSSPSITPVQVVLPPGVGSSQSLNFAPSSIKVVIGVNNTIIWVDQDSIPHTVTSISVPGGANSFDSGTLNKGGAFSVTLSIAGTYQYHCSFHPGWMKGTIVVVQG